MSGHFPREKPDWCNFDVIHRNVLPARSYFFLYETEAGALSADTDHSCSVKLSGTWKFHHSNSPFEAPQGFEAPTYDTSKWSDIQVPGMWQLQGWGKPHYTNVPYPFFVDPPNVPFDDNQTGSYARRFRVPETFANQVLRLRFEGVDSAFHVYVNGQLAGYSQGSRNPSEFDITNLVDFSAENTLAVRVYQYCDGSYLEDQDQWRFSGIFRDVFLLAFPQDTIQDFQIQTVLDDKYEDAELKLKLKVSVSEWKNESTADFRLLDAQGHEVARGSANASPQGSETTIKIANPKKWSAEDPSLYRLILSYGDRHIAQNVGFRKVEIKSGFYLVNGKRIVFRGANRHEHHPKYGRAVPYDFMKQDLLTMKRHNINALRTSHQPSDPHLYALADELGLWIMDEADVECHGFSTIDELALSPEDRKRPFDERKELVYGHSARFTSDNPDWRNQYVDRALQLVHRDKNHPCVVMWSLGNEAFYGCNFQSMYDEIKKVDQSRPIHYEGDSGTGSARSITEPQTVDLVSRMYPRVEDIIEFAKRSDITMPLVLCEYVHAMGNGPGNIKEYIDAFYKYPALQGGWVWEWANHGLKTKDSKTGEIYYAYGGDFGDEPNDYNFILDGVLFSDHTPTPGLIEYKKAIEPVQVDSYENGVLTIINRYDTIGLDHLRCEALLIGDGYKKPLGDLSVPANCAPHTKATIKLPAFDTADIKGDVYLQVDFSLARDTLWASAGHVVSSSQLQIQGPIALSKPSATSTTSITSTLSTLTVNTSNTTYTFSLPSGRLTSILKSSTELLHATSGPVLTLFRALTDNDRPQDGQDWLLKHVELAKPHTYSVTWSTQTDKSLASVIVKQRIGPPSLSWYLDATVTYTFHSSGQLHIHTSATPRGLNLPLTLPRLGLEFSMPASFSHISWFGRGPGESYRDKKLSQQFGNYSVATVDDLWIDYEFPQENGNRTDVRWVSFTSSKPSGNLLAQVKDMALGAERDTNPSLTARFGEQEGFSFQASHYRARDIEKAQHPYELKGMKREDEVIVRLDVVHHGLGTGSCGPKTREEYALAVREGKGWEFDVWFE